MSKQRSWSSPSKKSRGGAIESAAALRYRRFRSGDGEDDDRVTKYISSWLGEASLYAFDNLSPLLVELQCVLLICLLLAVFQVGTFVVFQ